MNPLFLDVINNLDEESIKIMDTCYEHLMANKMFNEEEKERLKEGRKLYEERRKEFYVRRNTE